MVRDNENNKNVVTQSLHIDISDKQTEMLAKRLLPEIKKFFANEEIRKEFEEWKKERPDRKNM